MSDERNDCSADAETCEGHPVALWHWANWRRTKASRRWDCDERDGIADRIAEVIGAVGFHRRIV